MRRSNRFWKVSLWEKMKFHEGENKRRINSGKEETDFGFDLPKEPSIWIYLA